MARPQETVQKERKQWSSELAFIASTASAAIGLGNLWRFPYMVGAQGGGAFVVAYLLALTLVVLPLMILDVAAGRLAQGSTVETYRQVNRYGAIYGWFVVLLMVAMSSYYLVITGWTLGYTFDAVRHQVDVFERFSQGYNSLWFFILTTLLAGFVLVRDLAGIETFSKLLMPVLLVVVLFLLYKASQTTGWDRTIRFFFHVQWSSLLNARIWALAFGQAFYTLSIGLGHLETYGSFIPRKTHLPRACLTIATFNASVALLAGFMIFPFVFSFGMEPGQGPALAFETLPRVFEEMSGGFGLSILFFGLFFLAAFSSCLAGLKVVIAAVAEEFHLSNKVAVVGVTLVMLILGTASALSFTPLEWQIAGEPVLNVIDRICGGNLIIFSGLTGAALLCWFIPPTRIRSVLGSANPWWEWRIYLNGRYLPFVVLIAAVVFFACERIVGNGV